MTLIRIWIHFFQCGSRIRIRIKIKWILSTEKKLILILKIRIISSFDLT